MVIASTLWRRGADGPGSGYPAGVDVNDRAWLQFIEVRVDFRAAHDRPSFQGLSGYVGPESPDNPGNV